MDTQTDLTQTPTEMLNIGESLTVDPEQIRAFTRGATYRPKNDGMPWSPFNEDDIARYNVSLRLNDYYLALLRYISKQQGISQQKFIANIVLPALDAELGKLKKR